MDIKVYYLNSSNIASLMVWAKTDLLYGNNNLQVEDIDETGAYNAGYTGLCGVVIKLLDYTLLELSNIVQAAHTQAFGNATNVGFKLTAEDENNQIVILNTKTT